MIDFHNHILPNVDDGSKSMEMSLNMLRTAAEQGITDVVNTVHFQHPKVDGKDISKKACLPVMEELQNESDKLGLEVKLHLGSEVFYLPNLLDISEDPLVTIGNGKYMLIEFLTHQLPGTHRQMLFDLKMKGITPIIAHPERYKPVQEDLGIIRRWLRAGCLIQVDAGSLTGSLGRSAHHTAVEIVKANLCQLVGSDSHDDNKRNFCLKEALSICESHVGTVAKLWVTENPRRILHGDTLIVDIDEDKFVSEKKFNFKWFNKRK
ncbi:MAG: tyrosine-protein phosphatase [Fidelibacterota bacterium]